MRTLSALVATATVIGLLAGCAAWPVPEMDAKISRPGMQSLSTILDRIKNKNLNEKYSLASPDISFEFSEVDRINGFQELTEFLEKKGYVYEIVANKYRIDLPKIITVVEKGRYAGNLSTVPFTPFYSRLLPDVMLDIGLQTKYIVNMDEDVLSESKRLQAPSSVFKGKTVADFLAFVETSYDYHVEIDSKSAIINVSKYKSKVFDVLADKEKIKKDAVVFLSDDIETKKVKQYVPDNGKFFVTGTPSVFAKVQRYAGEVNAENSERAIVSFNGKTSVWAIIEGIEKNHGVATKMRGSDFLPPKDSGVWFEKVADVDRYLRNNFNKKVTKISGMDIDRNGIEDFASYEIQDVIGVSLSSPMTVTGFFKKLSVIDGHDYIVDGDANIPVSKIKIDGFEMLKEFLYSSSAIIIEKTDTGNGLPIIIKVRS